MRTRKAFLTNENERLVKTIEEKNAEITSLKAEIASLKAKPISKLELVEKKIKGE